MTSERESLFITFEGVDGCGKTTQAALFAGALETAGASVVRLREPGGCEISEKIRGVILDPENVEMSSECELLLFEAARAQLVKQVVEPALETGAWVVCDRFADSTTAYQAGGRGLDPALVEDANRLGMCGIEPDVTVVLDIDVETAATRVDGDDRMEQAGSELQRKVGEAYRAIAAADSERVVLVDGRGTPEEVRRRVMDAILPHVPGDFKKKLSDAVE
jgi:dTMP kinase